MATDIPMVPLPVNQSGGGNPNGGTANTVRYDMKQSIFRVPAYIRDRNPNAYTPSVVSIGPYHHRQPHLTNMEEHKERALQQLLRRSSKSYSDFSNELEKSLQPLKDSYQQSGSDWKDNEFLRLMIRDGAFLCEYMRCFSSESPRTQYHGDDPVFGYYALLSLYPSLIPDIIMIENQLPLEVLERLIAVEKGQLNDKHFSEVYKLVFNFLGQGQPPSDDSTPRLHVLDVARKAITKDTALSSKANDKPATHVHSAVELSDAGLRFEVSTKQGTSGIKFVQGSLYLAPLCIDTFTEPLFLNSIAFERIRPSVGRQVSSYVAFMAGLIRTPADAGLLRSQCLVDCRIGDVEAVSKLMSTISENVFFDPYSNLCEVRDSLNSYYETKTKNWGPTIREWGRKFKQNYFDNPWTFISLLAATILLVLTALQTVYTMLSYYSGNGTKNAPSPS